MMIHYNTWCYLIDIYYVSVKMHMCTIFSFTSVLSTFLQSYISPCLKRQQCLIFCLAFWGRDDPFAGRRVLKVIESNRLQTWRYNMENHFFSLYMILLLHVVVCCLLLWLSYVVCCYGCRCCMLYVVRCMLVLLSSSLLFCSVCFLCNASVFCMVVYFRALSLQCLCVLHGGLLQGFSRFFF